MSSTTLAPCSLACSAAKKVALRAGSFARLVPQICTTLASATGAASTSSIVISVSAALSR